MDKISVSTVWNKPYLQKKQYLPPLYTGMEPLRATAPLPFCVADKWLVHSQIKDKRKGQRSELCSFWRRGLVPCAILPPWFGSRCKQS